MKSHYISRLPKKYTPIVGVVDTPQEQTTPRLGPREAHTKSSGAIGPAKYPSSVSYGTLNDKTGREEEPLGSLFCQSGCIAAKVQQTTSEKHPETPHLTPLKVSGRPSCLMESRDTVLPMRTSIWNIGASMVRP